MRTDDGLREARLSAFFDQAAAGMAETDATGRFLRVNDRYCTITGRSRDELLSLRMQDITHPDDLGGNLQLFSGAVEHGRGFEIEKRYVRPDGSFVWVHNSVTPIRDGDEGGPHTVCVTIDISDRKAAEEQLRRSQETFYNLIRNDPFGVYVVDADFRLAVISRGSEKVFQSVKPLIGRDFAEVINVIWQAPFAGEVVERFRHTLETGIPYQSHRTVERRGDIEAVEAYDWRIERIALPDGRYGVVCYFYDLSERERWETALRDASERVEIALDAGAIAGTWVWEVPNDRFTGDERFARYFGLDPEQCRRGIPLSEPIRSIHPDDRARVEGIIGAVLETGGDYRAEYRVCHSDGQYRWIEAVGRCELDGDGKPLRFPGVLVDIDLRKKDEAALAESEARFREVANAAPVLIWVADRENKGIWYNRAWLDFRGRSLDEELGDGWLEGVHPDDLERCAEVCGGSFNRREPFRLDFRLQRADGEWRVIDDSGVPRFSEDGEFLGYIGSCIDVTDARRSEAALRDSEEKHRRIFEQTSDLIFTADLNQVITACNPAAAAAVGLPREEAVGRSIADFVSPEDLKLTQQMLQEKLDRGGTTRYELRVHSTTGEWRYWEINSGLTFDESGSPVGLHVVGRDITDRKRLERHQQILVAELNHRVKNTLAIVQSIAHQTFRNDAPGIEAIASFQGRLEALAAAHSLLTARNWEAASIGAIIQTALAPFCSDARCEIDGPELGLPPETAVSLALAVHELATNASKYGALSNQSGRISIAWTVDADRFEFRWTELGGPPVEPPARTGFGSKMIKRTLAAEFGGDVEMEFASTGFQCRVAGPLPKQRP
jgi:PAS domain S-box-containing protein